MDETSKKPVSAFEKRVKRRIASRQHTFYISTAPGLIGRLEREVAETLGVIPERLTGGVSFAGRLERMWEAALSLRFANRILVRLAEFSASDFRRFEKRCREVPWELWLPEGAAVEVAASAHHCRLYHTGAIEERVGRVVDTALGGRGQMAAQRITVRGENDRFTLSLDATGDALYKRDLKVHGGRAPIRETLAAAILDMVGYTGAEPLVDPMCGTGTFSIEAAMVASHTAPGLFRSFAFEAWPSFRLPAFQHLREGLLAKKMAAPAKIVASDGDGEAIRRLKETLPHLPFGEAITPLQADFFELTPEALGLKEPGVVVFNPPYGKRIAGGGSELVLRLVERLSSCWAGWRIAIAVPKNQIPSSLRKKSSLSVYPLAHGGLDLSVLCGTL